MSYTAEKIYVRRVFTWNRHDAFAKQMAYGTFTKYNSSNMLIDCGGCRLR